jgi:photosystem II stability/assembly factor-like uncharacterized protein
MFKLKKVLFLIPFFIFGISYASLSFSGVDLLKTPAIQSPKASKGLILTLAKSGTRLLAAGERGIIVYSDDQGETWNQSKVPVSITITSIYFSTDKHGWAVGHDGVILATKDAGVTWVKQFDGVVANRLIEEEFVAKLKSKKAHLEKPNLSVQMKEQLNSEIESLELAVEDIKAGAEFGPSRPLFGVWFKNQLEGIVVGSFGQIFATKNGGETWSYSGNGLSNPDNFHFNSISMLSDGRLAITAEQGKIWISKDQGLSWELIDTGYEGYIYGVISIPKTSKLIAYGFAGNLFQADLGGKSWKPLPKLTNKSLISATVNGSSVTIYSGDRRQLMSNDYGQTFKVIQLPMGRPIAAIQPLTKDGDVLLVGGVGGVSILKAESKK